MEFDKLFLTAKISSLSNWSRPRGSHTRLVFRKELLMVVLVTYNTTFLSIKIEIGIDIAVVRPEKFVKHISKKDPYWNSQVWVMEVHGISIDLSSTFQTKDVLLIGKFVSRALQHVYVWNKFAFGSNQYLVFFHSDRTSM